MSEIAMLRLTSFGVIVHVLVMSGTFRIKKACGQVLMSDETAVLIHLVQGTLNVLLNM